MKKSDILEMLRFVLYVFTSAMQDEPANKTFFIDKVLDWVVISSGFSNAIAMFIFLKGSIK